MDIGIIGGGPMGLAIGYYAIKKGHIVSIYEKDDVLGGMSASFDFDGDIIEKYYHFFCKTDFALFELLKELDIYNLLSWENTYMGFYYKTLQSLGDPISLLRFKGVDIISKLRYALFSFYAVKKNNWQDLDKKYSISWIKSFLGEKAYNLFWDKLFSLKFYEYQDQVSAAWIQTRIKRVGLSRSSIFQETLGYVKGGVKTIIDTLEGFIGSHRGKIYLNASVESINPHTKSLKINGDIIKHDLIISTVPVNMLFYILEDKTFANLYKDFSYLDIMCVVIKLKKPLTKYFWININDDGVKIPGLINYSALRKDLSSHIVYMPFYLPKDSPIFSYEKDKTKSICIEYLKILNRDLKDEDFLAFDINIYKNAQGVYTPGYLYKLPRINITPHFLALDTTYYYPEDRGFSESVRIAKMVVDRYI